MSIRVMSRVWKLEDDLTSTEKLVLLKFADCCHPDGRNAFPKQKRIAAECRLTGRTVRDTIKSLLAKGYLSLQAERTHKLPATYQVVFPREERASALRADRISALGAVAGEPEGNVDPVEGNVDPLRGEIASAAYKEVPVSYPSINRTDLPPQNSRRSVPSETENQNPETESEDKHQHHCCSECSWQGVTAFEATRHYRATRHQIRVSA